MWLKSVKSIFRRALFSIAIRLTALYACVMFITLTIISVLLYYTLFTSLKNQAENFLLKESQSIRAVLIHQPQDFRALHREVMLEPMVDLGGDHYYVRIFQENGEVLVETPGMDAVLPLKNKLSKKSIDFAHENHAKNVVFLSSVVQLHSGKFQFIELALSMENENKILEEYRNMLAFILLFGVLISVVLGAWLTKKSMFPIKAIVKTLKHMTMNELHQRLDPHDWPKELFELALGLNEMLGRLDGSFKRLKQFSADLAHEIRTPINNLLGEAEVALKQARTPEDYQKVLASALEEYGRLHALVSGLLFLAETENPAMKIKREIFFARTIIDSVCDFYSAIAEEKNIVVQCDGDAKIWADPLLFRRVVNNLFANELKYTPSQGLVRISLQSESNGTYITITDNGDGIAPEHLPHLFDRFYRTDAARSQQQGGLGLGLAIVKSIMELHRGAIQIESELHQGTKISLYFPAQNMTKLS